MNTIQKTYDVRNNLQVINNGGSLTQLVHDAVGNLLSHADARGVTVTMTCNALNRVLTRSYPGTVEDVAFVYDNCSQGTGRLCSVQDQSGYYGLYL